MSTDTPRAREITWDDPAPFGRAAETMSGLEFLHAIGRGELPAPPMMRTLGIEPVEVEEGRAVFAVEPAGTGYTTLELKINFVRPLTARTGPVLGEGRVVHLGSRAATAEARVVDEQGRLYAHATTTCMILAPSAARPGLPLPTPAPG